MRTLAMDKPPGHNPVGLVEGNLVAVSPVTLKGTQVSKRNGILCGTVWPQDPQDQRNIRGARVWQSFQPSEQGTWLQSASPGVGSQLEVAIYLEPQHSRVTAL